MKIVFLSHPINERTPLYAGEKGICIKLAKSLKRGDSCNKTHVSFSAHTGTHLEAPRHFLDKGRAISDLKPGELLFRKVGLVLLKGIRPGQIISEKDLGALKDCELLLLRTGFEKERGKATYWKAGPGLDDGLAAYVKKVCPSLRAIGVDFISITSLRKRKLGRKAHKAFLSRGVSLIEDMRLRVLNRVPEMVIVAPLFIDKAEASPATVLAVYNRS